MPFSILIVCAICLSLDQIFGVLERKEKNQFKDQFFVFLFSLF